MNRSLRVVSLLGGLLVPHLASAHHSVAGTFDTDRIEEAEGEVTSVLWRNPHVRFSMSATDANGEIVEWDMEMTSLTNLRRRGLDRQLLDVGDQIRVAGNPAIDGSQQLYLRNVMLDSGEEVVLGNGDPRWSQDALGQSGPGFGEGDRSRPDLGIFRVWSTPVGVGGGALWNPSYPLTTAAARSLANFDPATDSPILNCIPKGMPSIMAQPYPMEIVERDGNIVLLIEEYDTVRTIYMDGEGPDWIDPRPLGYSVGRWEGDTLVVGTTGTSWRHFNTTGIPLNDGVTLRETFQLQDDGARLDYTITVNDRMTFTEPVTLDKFWAWLPEITVVPFNCTN
ncbi:MAG: DUF6152 family protein [Gammaproteobacteria bacterium]